MVTIDLTVLRVYSSREIAFDAELEPQPLRSGAEATAIIVPKMLLEPGALRSQVKPAHDPRWGIAVIDGGCPSCSLTADLGHEAMRFIFTLSGNVPREV